MKRLVLALAVAGLASTTAQAAPFAPFDVRSAAMGGAGVASAKAATAALFNPAMLSAERDEDDFQIAIGVGASAVDAGNTSNTLMDLADEMDALDNTLSGIQGSNLALDAYDTNLQQAGQETGRIAKDLHAVSGNSLNLIPGAIFAFGVPSAEKVGVGVYANVVGQLSVTPKVAPTDVTLLNRYSGILADGVVSSAEVSDAANADLFVNTAGTTNDVVLVNPDFQPNSQASVIGIASEETGVALSHRLDLPNGAQLALGVTPKSVNVVTWDYTADSQNFDAGDASKTDRTDSYVDADLGAVFRPSEASEWQFGGVIKDIAAKDQTTSGGHTIKMAPQMRVGVGRMMEHYTLAADLDLTKNAGSTAADETQFLALGAEWGGRFGKLRAGYRANLASGSDVPGVVTVGFAAGFLSTAFAFGGNTMAANLQIGFGW